MDLSTVLQTLFIGPLKLVFEIIFVVVNRVLNQPGLTVIVLSVIINILVLPLYKRADDMQEETRVIENKLRKGIVHIKKTFTGDERMMILQTYYRQNNYKPTDALNGSVSLLLQIPFFMAAYQFLSTLDLLEGVAFGPISDLSAPDGLLVIENTAINLLPIIMTLVNVVSSAIYLKGHPLKTKVQLYAMALFFLVFLYTSPSGLVLYWTMNNVFSLGKTIFYKIKNPERILKLLWNVLKWVMVPCGIAAIVLGIYMDIILVVCAGAVLLLPAIWPLMKSAFPNWLKNASAEHNTKQFVIGAVFLTLVVGLMIPSNYIAASPQEFVDVTLFHHPLLYIVSSVCLAAGFFMVWMGVFYWLAPPKVKVLFDKIIWILCGVMLINYLFFGTDLGVIYANLKYENEVFFTNGEKVWNLLIVIAVAMILYIIAVKWNRSVTAVLLTASLAVGVIGGMNIIKINNSIAQLTETNTMKFGAIPEFTLSKNGKNVVVIMLDRAVGEYVPYILNEKPELQEQFDGFTFYSNTLSYSCCTNMAVPALLGGYDYTPVEMNKRDELSLKEKHNESLLLMPTLFSQNGFDVTLCDPPYANYQWIPDLSLFDPYPEIDAYITNGVFLDEKQKEAEFVNNHRNFFCFSIMKTLPLVIQTEVYNHGNYFQASGGQKAYQGQIISTTKIASGISANFIGTYNVLKNMSHMSKIADTGENTFLFMMNEMPHYGTLLQAPSYVPADQVDNTQYEADFAHLRSYNGNVLRLKNRNQMMHYHSNMAAMIQLGRWFDFLRENGVYDNTRIIVVSDHSYSLYHHNDMVMDGGKDIQMDLEYYCPLLMVKDFGSTGFAVCDEFMTNADVPTLAMDGLIDDPVNPFTGNPINSDQKTAHDQLVLLSQKYHIDFNNGNMFLPDRWASVKDNVWDIDNWTVYNEATVLTEHELPTKD